MVKIRVFGGRIKESIFGWRWFDLRIVMKCSERYIGAYIFFYCPVDWVQIWGCWVHWHIFNEYFKGKLKKMILGGGGLTWKLSWNFQIKLFPPKKFFLYVFLVFFGYMLMCLTFSGLDSVRRLMKEEMRALMYFSGHFRGISRQFSGQVVSTWSYFFLIIF